MVFFCEYCTISGLDDLYKYDCPRIGYWNDHNTKKLNEEVFNNPMDYKTSDLMMKIQSRKVSISRKAQIDRDESMYRLLNMVLDKFDGLTQDVNFVFDWLCTDDAARDPSTDEELSEDNSAKETVVGRAKLREKVAVKSPKKKTRTSPRKKNADFAKSPLSKDPMNVKQHETKPMDEDMVVMVDDSEDKEGEKIEKEKRSQGLKCKE